MMRFLPSFFAVESLRQGKTPKEAAYLAIERIRKYNSNFFGAIIVLNQNGEFGAACNGMEMFPFIVASKKINVTVQTVKCIP